MLYRRTEFISPFAAGLIAVFLVCSARGAVYYIGPSGNNSNSGTSAGAPWATFPVAFTRLLPGDTLLVLDGTYNLNTRVRWQSGGGTSSNRINVWAAPGASPVLDFGSMSNTLWGQSSGRGIEISDGVDWLHFKGLTVQNARDNGFYSESDHSVFEQLVTRWNGDSGLQLDGFSANNLVLNSDSYLNYDPSSNGENADGFAIKFAELGPGNVVRGSRAWGNADDGWDMWESTIGGVLVEDSWAFDNGKLIQQFFDRDALEEGDLTAGNFNGDGTGYKLGQDGGPHVLNRVLAWANRVGIDVNGNGNGVTVNNSTAYNNARNWQFDENLSSHVLRNNISLTGQGTTSGDTIFGAIDDAFNSWNPGIGTATAADFVTLVDTLARGPRQADGSLPIVEFLHLVATSDLIDAGIDVGLPYFGAAPDLGAFETGGGLEGDFNEDGIVDAADYVAWRKNDGTPEGYDAWLANFGATAGSGSTEALHSRTIVPEPTALILGMIGLAAVALFTSVRRS
jgi:hypothetical protein